MHFPMYLTLPGCGMPTAAATLEGKKAGRIAPLARSSVKATSVRFAKNNISYFSFRTNQNGVSCMSVRHFQRPARSKTVQTISTWRAPLRPIALSRSRRAHFPRMHA